MTVGSWNRDSFTNLGSGYFIGLKTTKSWSGADRPKTEYQVDPPYRIVRYETLFNKRGRPYEKKVVLKFPKRRVAVSKPPNRGISDEHAYTATFRRQSDERWTLKHEGVTYPNQSCMGAAYKQSQLWTVNTCPTFTANDQAKLVEKLRERVLGSEFNFANFVGESKPALRMIADSAGRIYRSLGQLKRGNLIGAANSLVQGTPLRGRLPRKNPSGSLSSKDLSNLWLEIQYGWLPLLKDTEECAQFVAHQMSVPFRQTYRAMKRIESGETTTIGGWWDGWEGNNNRPVTRQVRTTERFIKAILTEKPGVAASLGLLNPETVAWEIMPWSFVIDWFIPIGQYLQARSFAASLSGTFVTTDVKRGSMSIVTMAKGSPRISAATNREISIARSISTSLDVGTPVFKPLSSVPSIVRALNSIALLNQRR